MIMYQALCQVLGCKGALPSQSLPRREITVWVNGQLQYYGIRFRLGSEWDPRRAEERSI